MEDLVNRTLWRDKRVFLTGHTGFKGGWLALWLSHLGAKVRGYALDPSTTPNFFTATRLHEKIEDLRGDIRNPATLDAAIQNFAPEVIFHLAAQPLVRASYEDPITTYEINVIGTARILDAVRRTPSVKAVVCITTDKCYENKEWIYPYHETDPLGGYDPYSSSKACAEIATASFRQSYFHPAKLAGHEVAIATARAGNVIGGGDWSPDRLIPDLVRGFLSGSPVLLRHPQAIRLWQHVLETLHGYLLLAEKLLAHDRAQAARYATAYNFGPSDSDAQPVAWIADKLADLMIRSKSKGASWTLDEAPSSHEAHYLKLDSSRARAELHWVPRLNLETSLQWLVQWYRSHQSGADMQSFTLDQIAAFETLAPGKY
jgi:CDP-glucose 4,6-dehydratase